MVDLDIRFRDTWYTEEQYKAMTDVRSEYINVGVLFSPYTIKVKLGCEIEQAEELYQALEEDKHAI